MNIDPIQILQVTFYSKIVNEVINIVAHKNINMSYLFIVFLLYKIITTDKSKEYFENYYNKWINTEEESILIIPQHKRIFTTYAGSQSRETVQ